MAEFNAPPPPDRPHTWRLARAIDACLPFNRDLRRDFIPWQELWLRGVRDTESRSLAGDLYLELRD